MIGTLGLQVLSLILCQPVRILHSFSGVKYKNRPNVDGFCDLWVTVTYLGFPVMVAIRRFQYGLP